MRRILLGAVLAAATIVPVPAAHAGTYDVWACKDANGKAVGAGGWGRDVTSHNAIYGNSSCAPGATPGVITIAQNGGEPFLRNTSMAIGFRPPEGQTIANWDVTYDAKTPFAPDQAWSQDFTVFQNEPNFADNANINDYCWGSYGCGSASRKSAGGAARGIWLFQNCNGSGRPQDCPAGQGGQITLRQARVALNDTADPTFPGAPSGPLVSGQTVSGVAAASFGAADAGGGGVARVIAEVDGRQLGATPFDNGGQCVVPYSTVNPCQAQVSGQVAVDTRTLPDGAHSLRVLVVDAGGNVGAAGPYAFTVANGPTACAPSTDPVVSASLYRNRKTRTVRYGLGSTVTGTVKRADGTPVAGATVVVAAGRGSRYAAVATVQAGPDGAWRAKVPAGTTRTVIAQVRQGDAAPTCSRRLKLRTRAGVKLKASRRSVSRSGVARFSGRVKGSRAGRANVVLQGYGRGRWRTVAVARVSKSGRLRARYSFSGNSAGTYKFRALVRAGRNYPYASGKSKTVSVRAR